MPIPMEGDQGRCCTALQATARTMLNHTRQLVLVMTVSFASILGTLGISNERIAELVVSGIVG